MRPLLPLLSLLLIFWLAGCEGKEASAIQQSAAPVPVVQMPEAMPEDFAFSVRFGITGKNEINTFEHTVTKDLVIHGTAQADLQLTADELADIYARMREINILRGLDLEPVQQNCSQIPYDEEHWEIRLNGERQSFDWSEEHCGIPEDALQLKELRSYIFELVKKKPEYQQLPEAEGGYE